MKLLRCHIENFGVLSDFELTFEEKLTLVCRENGFGKSTLAAFLKAMFYGLPRTGSRNAAANERKRYEPWQGGRYGGFLEFSYRDKTYRVTRYFGKTAAKDTFELWNLTDRTDKTPFSSNLGEALFQLDAESFARSTFFPQGSLHTLEATGSMRTKLGDLVDNTNDMNNYDTAQTALHDYRGRLKAYRGAGGEIGRLTQEKERLEAQIFEAEKKRPRLDEVLSQISSLNEKEEAQTQSIGALREKIRAAAAEEARKLRRAQGTALREAAESKKRTVEDLQAQYPAGLPALPEIRRQREKLAAAREADNRLRELTLSEDDRKTLEENKNIFQNKEETEGDIQTLARLQQELSQLRPVQMPQGEKELYEALSEKFRAGVPAAEIKRCQDDCRHAAALLAVQKEKRQQAELAAKTAAQRQKFLLIAGFILILTGIAGFAARLTALSAVLAGAGILALAAAVITRKKNASVAKADEDERTAEKIRREAEAFLLRYYPDASEPEQKLVALRVDTERYASLRQQAQQTDDEQQRQNRRREELLGSIREILSGYGFGGKEAYEEEIRLLQSRFQAYCRAEEREQELQNMRRQLEARKKAFEEDNACFAAQYRLGADAAEAQLDRAEDALHALLQAQRELSQAQQALHTFIEENGEAPEAPQPEACSMEQYQQKEKAAQDELESTQAQLRLLRQEGESLRRETEEIGELSFALSQTDDTRRELQKKCELADRTIEYLASAKDALAAGYAAPVEQSFVRYAQELLGKTPNRAMLDRDLHLFIDEQGQARSADSFSAGTLDGLMLCMRLSLVDALFKEEEPFLILDDPFVNLDDARTKRALSILQKLSQKRQIVYLTCSTARI